MTWRLRPIRLPPIVSILCPLLHSLTSNVGNFVNVLMLILHGCCYCRVAHRLHYGEEILSCPVHFGSEAVTSTVKHQVIRQAGIFPSVLELPGHRSEMATPCPF
jgi:hypothetical protein